MENTITRLLILVIFIDNAVPSRLPNTPIKLQTYSIPDKRPLKKALGFYEDTYLNFTELTTKYDYPTEVHTVTTEDGYILTVFRILPKCNGTVKGFPIVLWHGINDSSDEWILSGPQTGLGYVLADHCYDVWAANHRGNVYSRRHIRLNPNMHPEYWNYTFDEHGNYDVPAVIDHVLVTTQQPKVNYIGHSQGTTVFFVMTSLKPEYNQKINLSFQLAPIAWLKNINSPLPILIAPRSEDIKNILIESGFSELLAKHQLTHTLLEFLCQFSPDICSTGLFIATGYKYGNITPKNIAILFGHLFVGGSAKSLNHFGQLVRSGRFQRYDEGRKGNMKRYGLPKPPVYDVSKVTSDVVLICTQSDWLSTSRDVDILTSKLPNVIEKYVLPDPTMSHNDIVHGISAPKYVFSKILDLLEKYDKNNI